ncbi:serine protease 7-like [Dermacentor variabilis]|uniref:serine protease 7-like n=1 Tax=Dermacentor variabilis TaxID=34621 RepID=UPI003F5C2C3F
MASLPSDYVPRYTQHYLTKVALVIFVTALPVTANKMDTNLKQAGCGELGSNGRIYNGKPTSNEKMPWIVQIKGILDLWTARISSCGGSIITRNLILTAAHCLFDKISLEPAHVLCVILLLFGGGVLCHYEPPDLLSETRSG